MDDAEPLTTAPLLEASTVASDESCATTDEDGAGNDVALDELPLLTTPASVNESDASAPPPVGPHAHTALIKSACIHPILGCARHMGAPWPRQKTRASCVTGQVSDVDQTPAGTSNIPSTQPRPAMKDQQ
jgi:hypothetical protein